MNITLVNGQYLDDNNTLRDFGKIVITDGKITAINEQAKESRNSDYVIDCKGKTVLPTLTDLSVTLNGTGATSLQREQRAAAAGGVGRMCLQPQTSPINDTPSVAKLIERNARDAQGANILQLGAMTKGLEGELLSEYAEMKDSSCIGFSHAYSAPSNLAITARCFEYAHTFDVPIFMHPMESSLYKGSMHNGSASCKMGLKGIPETAETIAIAQLCLLAERVGVHLHLAQISSAASVALIAEAKEKGLSITADAALPNLLFTDEAALGFSSIYHTLPPLREEHDRKAILEGLRSGVIDAISSGHRPCGPSGKQAPFAESKLGMSTIEHMLNYAYLLDSSDDLPLATFIQAANDRAAAILGLAPSKISVGEQANLSVFNPHTESTIDQMISKGRNSPFTKTVKGRVEATFIDGKQVYSAE